VLIVGGSTFAFYSIMYKVITEYQARKLKDSANNLIYVYRSIQTETEEEFISIPSNEMEILFNNQKLQTKNIDFILEESNGQPGYISRYLVKHTIYLPGESFNLEEFLSYNPYVMVMSFEGSNGRKYFYGKIFNTEILDEISQKINSDVAIVWDGIPTDFSNPAANQKHLYILIQAAENLKDKNNFELYTEGTKSEDILAANYKPAPSVHQQGNIYFLIFTTYGEAGELRSTLKDMFLIVCIVGVALSLIITFLFTAKLRKQITELSKATEQTHWGNLKHRIKIKSKDEIGKLGQAFNKMLDELDKKERAKNEYSDFITLINQNPTLKEVSEAALKKIIDIGDFVIGGLYSVDDEISLICSYGFDNKDKGKISAFINSVLKTKETLELYSEDTLPIVSTGLLDIKIKYLLFLPIIYNNKPIALLELGSLNKPDEKVKDYLEKIKDQLAIGMTNAKALMQLEYIVAELKRLNEEYHKQNIQIKQQNQTLLQLHEELKEQAMELEKQKQKAVELTKVKSQFLASMSHELRTPMNSILGLTELMLEKAPLDLRNKERLEVVLHSGKRLMTLINDILDLSKIEAGRMEVRYEDVMLDEIIEEISGAITPLANRKGIDFQIVKDTDTRILINTDRGKVVQVLINLLGNAVKFTEEGEVIIRISASDEMLNFEVIDTGIGISEADEKLIFEEFNQANGVKSKKQGGTGLGLAISKKLTNLLGGNISVRSKLQQGSTFTFSLPLKQSVKIFPGPQSKINIQTLIRNRKNPILIIDDEEEVRYTIGQYLLSRGYDVIFAEDGIKGLQMAIDNQPFAITLDIMLPNKDGWGVLKDLKENPRTKDIPVMLVSIIGDKNTAYSLGAFEYFVKPISSDKLLSAFSKLESLVNRKIQKIVVVDDDELEFEKFKNEFASDNIRIEFIKDSEYAFSKISEVQPDLIIIDLMMPKIDGITLSNKLKSNIKTRHIPILISTAKELTEEERKSLDSIVENIAVKSKGHPLDVIKIVRERIEMQEKVEFIDSQRNGDNQEAALEERKTPENEVNIEQNITAEVLIVDDDSDTLFTLDEIVQTCGCITILAKNGKECLEILESKTPDLILLDIIMPEMDGFQTIKQIRRNSKWADLPVIAVTAKAMKEDNEIILKHGFSDYIPKPVNHALVSFKIQKLISQLKAS
jgi:signal transduction histidine kinase/CheY-like chemotaxis protein/HAMP domain-containing protein